MACVVENADTHFESPSVPYFQDVGHDSSASPVTGLADRQFAVALLVGSVTREKTHDQGSAARGDAGLGPAVVKPCLWNP